MGRLVAVNANIIHLIEIARVTPGPALATDA